MINIEDKHFLILKSILNKYDCSFFLFGSRVTENVKKFSDIDLLYFEEIDNGALLKLEEEFEDSDLPYKVDLLNYNKCDEDFKRIIGRRYICLQVSSRMKVLEQNYREYFSFFSEKLGGDFCWVGNVLCINCGFKTSKFNIAYGAPKSGVDFDSAITTVKRNFKGQPFSWWIPPSQHSEKNTAALINADFIIKTIEHGMICDLENTPLLEQKTDLSIKSVTDERLLQDFISILEPYNASVRAFYRMIKIGDLDREQKFFVGYFETKPVVISILSISNLSAGIFSMLTKGDMRVEDYSTDMIRYLLATAKKNNCKYVTLSITNDSRCSIYNNIGFYKIGEFECFEYKGSKGKAEPSRGS